MVATREDKVQRYPDMFENFPCWFVRLSLLTVSTLMMLTVQGRQGRQGRWLVGVGSVLGSHASELYIIRFLSLTRDCHSLTVPLDVTPFV
jgi:hypothetical protein